MNQIVLIALRRPYTFVVLSILIVIFGIRAIRHSPTDVFPTIKIPVISVVWAYAGMLPTGCVGSYHFLLRTLLDLDGGRYLGYRQPVRTTASASRIFFFSPTPTSLAQKRKSQP